MKITNISAVMAAAAVAAAGIIGAAPIALADDSAVTTAALGSQAKLDNGNVIQGWTVTDLKPSTDTIPYQVHGTLWEVTATNEALQGSVTPIVSNFNARATDGENYRALFQVATAQGVNPATIGQGEKTSGKVYFDVTEADPTTVVYNAGGTDLAVWNQPAPSPAATDGGNTVPLTNHPAEAPAAAPVAATPAPAATPAAVPAAAPGGAGTRASDLPATAEGAVPASNDTPVPEGATAPAAGNAATATAPAEEAPAAAAAATEPNLVPEGAQPTTPTPAAPVSNNGPTS
ncbi:MPT63 family protein [Mycobacterium sp. 141]|uniref:MPT63 family protein n=1 Tax=Mycobacterium sp. 141 TaxID=1120797 RepID=UPI000378DDDB|nr:MPT63 family protein [Mycobacterium sp. 141]